MADPALIESLPDLVVLVQRDGTLLSHAGGCSLPSLQPAADSGGRSVQDIWPAEVADLIGKLTRRAIAQRGSAEANFRSDVHQIEARASAQGPDRALCVIRALNARAAEEARTASSDVPGPQPERRGLLRRFRQSVATARLAEHPLSAIVIKMDGAGDIARVIDSHLAEEVLAQALRRVPAEPAAARRGVMWYIGPLNDHSLLMLVDSGEREYVEALLREVCDSLRTPVAVGDANFSLTPYGGVAVLGRDGATADILLDQARGAAAEARRAGKDSLRFFSDTVRVRSLARLDMSNELAEAIRQRAIRLRYVGRHELQSGAVVCCVGYLRWEQPFRGLVRPRDFLAVAETAGLAVPLSRAMLECLAEDYGRIRAALGTEVCVSLGALRQHLLSADFCDELLAFLRTGRLPAERLELRIGERTFLSMDPARLKGLASAGVRLIVDEVGRDLGSLDRLASAPLSGLQMDRSWVSALPDDARALRVCRAGLSVARALSLTAIAMGVDTMQQRDALLALGCEQGLGDLYHGTFPTI